MNTGSSPYHAIEVLFCRGPNEELLGVEGRNADIISTHWRALRAQVRMNETESSMLPSGVRVETTPINILGIECLYPSLSNPDQACCVVREIYHEAKGCYVGLLSCHLIQRTDEEALFQDWMETFFLLETTLWPHSHEDALKNDTALLISHRITDLFEKTLRNISCNDEWDLGKHLFLRRVLGSVARNERIQMACPAFPCKSPNTRKVGGRAPDMAEQIALRTLHTFTQRVQSMYSPGVTIWIVSDGHVFSDCIGVDDQTVSDYDENLKGDYQSMYTSPEDRDAIRFRGLTEMFFSNPDLVTSFPNSYIDSVEISHPIDSARCTEAETARKIMMAGCQSSRDNFQRLVAEQHPPTLNLYRGQARFMQEDLSTPDFLSKSAKQKKKLSFTVAAEMIARNQAYSNLLELLFPNYIRLSIHAHSNRGPKFGICLFPRDKVRAINSVKYRHELVPAYEFQVPTPWHNAVIRVVGDDGLYVGKAEIVRAAIDEGEFEGGWVDGADGGHFALTPKGLGSLPLLSEGYPENKDEIVVTTESVESVEEDDHKLDFRGVVSLSSSTMEYLTGEKGKSVTGAAVEVADVLEVKSHPKGLSTIKLRWVYIRSLFTVGRRVFRRRRLDVQ